MSIQVNKIRCPHNHACPLVRHCPAGAITQGRDGYPIIDDELCTQCERCVILCPSQALEHN